MQHECILVFGCSDKLANSYDSTQCSLYFKANNNTSGLKADERAIAAQGIPMRAVSTGSAIRNGETHVENLPAACLIPEDEIDLAIREIDCKAIKIG